MKPYTLIAVLLAVSSMQLEGFHPPTDYSQKGKPATLKILIDEHGEGSILEVRGLYEVFDPISHIQLDSGFFGKRQPLHADGSGIIWGERLPGFSNMRIVPGNQNSSILVNGIQYRGCIEIYNQGGHLAIVNEIDVENYLKSVLSAQVSLQNESSLLEAIAIIARTNAYYLAERNRSANWHATAEELKYSGYGMTLQNLAIDRAVENTRHIVMTFNNHPFAATWTEDSAGRTARYADIFRKQAATPPGVPAPLAGRERENHAWMVTLPVQEFAQAFGFNKLTAVNTYLDNDSEKVYAVQLTDGNSTKNVDFFALQKELGADKLRSNDFEVSLRGDRIVFKGYGKGHGVGLCLYSGQMLADKGANVSKILTQFYPQVEMKKLRTLE